MMVHISIGEREYGSVNYYRGEHDVAVYYRVMATVPVYFEFRRCMHVVLGYAIGKGQRVKKLSEFARVYFGLQGLPPRFSFIIKPFRPRRRLVALDIFLLVSLFTTPLAAVFIIPGLVAGWQNLDIVRKVVLMVLSSVPLTLVAAFVTYLIWRRPSARQFRIRRVVADLLGPFSDPAGWLPNLVYRVAADWDVPDIAPEQMLAEAGRRFVASKFAEAVLIARLALAVTDDTTGSVSELAEAMTDEGLATLAGEQTGER